MMAWQLVRFGEPAQLREVPVPRPQGSGVLVRVAGNGLCHSDVGMMDPRMSAPPFGWQLPFTLGHEIAGWVEETGPDVAGFSPGQPVILVATHSDGTCAYCRSGRDNNCEAASSGRGYGRDGGLAPYVLIDTARPLIRLKTLDPRTAGPLADAGATSMHALERVRARLGEGSTAVVIGAGGLGSFAVQLLRQLTPARVIAVDINPTRLDYARRLGAHETVAGVRPSTAADLRALTGGAGADVVLDFVGIDDTIESGLASLRRTGAYGLIGAGMGRLNRPWFHLLPRDGEVFSFTGSTIADLEQVVALAEAGRLVNETETFAFSAVPEAYRRLDRGELLGRAVVVPDS
ncbi:MAG: NAD(P)-dependent alcohol dehydrogenase [Proteobacteria bacterium]|nr:NAD(P)-dependent alcohol dehydrogenase [Pseudomonadota bacterium]